MSAKLNAKYGWTWLAASMLAGSVMVNSSTAQPVGTTTPNATAAKEKGRASGLDPQGSSGAPRIVATSPRVGDTDVDPSRAEITVTFDREMGEGCSWTGGGPEFPASPEGQKAKWRDKRTCVLPVKLEAARYYRVGINSKSFQNFRSANGVPVLPSAIYFTTQGASEAQKLRAKRPQIIAIEPRSGVENVDPSLTELRVTFSVPMGDGCSWTGGGPQFPAIPEGKKPYWTEDHKTCVLPVQLQAGSEYRLGLNSPSHKNFQSVDGIPLDPVSYTFKTRP